VSLPAAPHAVLKVGSESSALVIDGAAVIFDASASTGDGLKYHLDFGDGQSSTQPVVFHRPATAWSRRATLTVSDRANQTATSTVEYRIASLDEPLFWANFTKTDAEDARRLYVRREGTTFTGKWRTSETGNFDLTARITGERTVEFVTADGETRLSGSVEWRPSSFTGKALLVFLRLRIHGGPEDGATFDFIAADPY
jgi:hypothetical protein